MKLKSSELKSFFVGNLLGDACIHNGSFSINQISKDLIEFKAKIIRESFPEAKIKVTEHDAKTDKNGTNHKKYWNLYVSPNEYLKKLELEFYPEGKKIVPKKYLNSLTDLALAIWYADDGTTVLVGKNEVTGSAKNRRLLFCTDSFSLEDVESLRFSLGMRFEKVTLNKRKDRVYRISIGTFCGQEFIAIIYPYFEEYFPSLLYKMDFGYRNESLQNRRYVTQEYSDLFLKMSAHNDFVDRMQGR